MSDMLQVPGNGTVSLPPSQTSTVVVNMSSEEPNSSDDVRSTHNSVIEMDASAERDPEPQVLLTFLLLSGRRKTYAFEQDCSIAVVKERLVREWPSEWEDEMRPQTVSQIRLLHYGRQLLDNETLSAKSRFQPRPAPPTLVHVSIRPPAVRTASATESFKQKASMIRTANFSLSRRGLARPSGAVNQHSAGDTPTQLDSVRERQDSNSGCCCVIC